MNDEPKPLVVLEIPKEIAQKRFKNRLCMNCGKKGPHFVPPSLGEPGFYMCDSNPERVIN